MDSRQNQVERGSISLNTEEPYDELVELRKFNALLRSSLDQWLDKTHWVQITSAPHELGLHRADVLKGRVESLQGRLAAVEGQRDRLVDALSSMLTYFGMDEDPWSKPVFDKARAAIKSAKGEKA